MSKPPPTHIHTYIHTYIHTHRDDVTGECFRADKLLEDAIDELLAANPYMPAPERVAHQVTQRQVSKLLLCYCVCV